jgi:hypothetical protein
MSLSCRSLGHWQLVSGRRLCSRALQKIGAIAVTRTDLSDVYRDYIACLNEQDWPKLGQFVHDEAIHNGRRIGLSGYREMLEKDFEEIPDLISTFRCLFPIRLT